MARVAQTAVSTGTGSPADFRLRSWSMNSLAQRIAAGPRVSLPVIARPRSASTGIRVDRCSTAETAAPRLLHLIVGCAAILAVLTGCSKDPLDINCSDFLAQENNQQLITAAQWGHPSRDGTYNAGDQLARGQYVKDLRSYCQGANHRNDSLNNLELRLG